MIHRPEEQEKPLQPQQGKLILPAPPVEETHKADSGPVIAPVRPEQLLRQPMMPPPQGPMAKVRYYWQKDPAYKVLMVAMAMVIISGLVFAVLISRAFLQNPNFFTSSYSTTAPTGVTPTGTVDLKPTFPPPNGGQGSSASSQPPAQSTPTLQPTPVNTPQPSPTPQGTTLTVQITSIPPRVQNNSVVEVGVNTSEAGVQVQLYIQYSNAYPSTAYSGSRITNDNGNATIPWDVHVFMMGRHAQATVIAIATDGNGQQAQSQPVTVEVIGYSVGG